jgi:hypothetical protein
MYSVFRFDCTGTGGGGVTYYPTATTVTVTATTGVTTTTTTTVTTTTVPYGAPVAPIYGCPAVTAWVNAGPQVNIITGLLGIITNLFHCSQTDLLTGTYGVLRVRTYTGAQVRVGTVLIKIQPDNTLYVRATADAGYDIVSLGVTASCNLLGLLSFGSTPLTSCNSFGLCNVLGGLTDCSSVGLLNLGNILGFGGQCGLLGLGSLQFGVQAVVRKVAFVGESC